MRRLDRRRPAIAAAVLELLGELDDQDGVLGGQADQHDEAHLRQNVVVHPAQDHAGDRGDEAHRHDEDHRQRQRQALVLSGKHQEHEHDSEREGEDGRRAGAQLLEGQRGPLVAEARRQRLRRQLLHDVDRLTLRIAGRRRAVELGGGIEVVARHAVGPGDVAHRREGAERHGVALVITHADLQDVARLEPEGGIGLGRHAEGASEQIEVVDVGRAEVGLQRGEHVGDLDAEHLRLGAVDIQIELRRRCLEQRVDLVQAWRLRGPRHHGVDGFLQLLRAVSAAVLDHHAEAAGGPDAAHGGRHRDDDHTVLDHRQFLHERGLDRGRRFRRVAGPLLK